MDKRFQPVHDFTIDVEFGARMVTIDGHLETARQADVGLDVGDRVEDLEDGKQATSMRLPILLKNEETKEGQQQPHKKRSSQGLSPRQWRQW
ncbi:hypothetical protein C1H46_036123 [Malus baccata]|uniref:Uncharacterized protein n=1 Tax=Malus baccata TaxID=106549 RepID=A0A540KVR9_MALBA|nr:hypothetical protein C1H46_036123 [Malus baccata]